MVDISNALVSCGLTQEATPTIELLSLLQLLSGSIHIYRNTLDPEPY